MEYKSLFPILPTFKLVPLAKLHYVYFDFYCQDKEIYQILERVIYTK